MFQKNIMSGGMMVLVLHWNELVTSCQAFMYPNQALGLCFCDVETNLFHFGERNIERGMWHDYCSISIITNMRSLSKDLTVTQTMKTGGVVLSH